MMKTPYLEIKLDKIVKNTRKIVSLAAKHGIKIFGVTKGVCGDPQIAQAMVRGGVKGLADSRIENIKKLNSYGFKLPLVLLRIPMLSEIERVINYVDISLNSQLEVIEALNKEARSRGKTHKIILMVDLGDRREGILPKEVKKVVGRIKANCSNIKIVGLGTNLACFGGVLPTAENMNHFIRLVEEAESVLENNLQIISAGNSSSLPLLHTSGVPQRVNQLRIGESILLGSNLVEGGTLPSLHSDTFILGAEIVELNEKGALPDVPQGPNAFGEELKLKKDGIRERAILAIGRQDISPNGLTPCLTGVEIEGGSSDHLIIDITDVKEKLKVGDILEFKVDYSSLLRATTSPYVDNSYSLV
ncbi:Predicted amino acid racemase [Candidatus Frackibacter sp. WG12]|nr:MAG: alanine racemase [Candidatus Frackibacter sp. T328-2]SDC22872.1 Predicted amino acid racemase [Candidatus Frackibacter sp. WG11]SEM49014.1 Predicted amino acid racemase [Candidatus Frackibacter sp. WG12]SFL50666.1 Predicted amino acid racemase [Candidatus Frackibacter sp. WG13]